MIPLRTYYTTGDLAAMIGISGAAGRQKIAAGKWKPSARTLAGGALFTQSKAAAIVQAETGARAVERRAQGEHRTLGK